MKKILIDDPNYEFFLAALDHEIKNNWYKKAYLFAQKSGMSQGNLSKIATKKTYAPYETQLKIIKASRHLNDYKSFITFGREIEKKDVAKHSNDCVDLEILKNAKHHNIIDQFEQPKLAEEINAILLEIEKIKKVRLKKIKNILQAELDELMEEFEQESTKKRTANGE